jgi:hypothetical protein
VDPAAAVELATRFGETEGMDMFTQWRNFWMYLCVSRALRAQSLPCQASHPACSPPSRGPRSFATFRDGGILTPSTATQCAPGQTFNCTAKLQPNDNEVGYADEWRGRIATENPDRYRVPSSSALDETKMAVMSGKRRGREAMRRSKA